MQLFMIIILHDLSMTLQALKQIVKLKSWKLMEILTCVCSLFEKL